MTEALGRSIADERIIRSAPMSMIRVISKAQVDAFAGRCLLTGESEVLCGVACLSEGLLGPKDAEPMWTDGGVGRVLDVHATRDSRL